MKSFCQIHNFQNLLDKTTCQKNPTNPSCVNLIRKNKPRSLQNSCTFETRLSDFHKMTLTVLKSFFAKSKPIDLNYRNYKVFNNTLFRDQVLNKQINLQINNKGLKPFKETCLSAGLLKSSFVRANQAPFINKEIQRAVMVRSKLRKKFLKIQKWQKSIQ